MDDFYALRIKSIWAYFRGENFSFWMICCYLFVEYVRPQSIIPALDILPWASVFVLLALVGSFMDRTVKWVKAPASKWMVAYFIVVLLSSANAQHPNISWQYLNLFYTWLVIYFLIINIVNTQKRLFIFLGIFVISSFKISLSLAITWAQRGFAFTDWGLMGPPGFFQNSGELAIQMSVFFPIAYLIAAKLKPYVSRWVFYILALMPITAAMVVLGASSRGGQVALAIQLILMFYKQLFRIKTLIPVAIVFVLIFNFLPDAEKQRFSESGKDKTSLQRLNYWRGGREMLDDYPVLGVGYFNFPSYFEAHYRHLMLYPQAQLPHNIFVQVGSELGYSGLFVYSILITKCFFWRKQQYRGMADDHDFLGSLPWALNISIVGFFVAGQFVSVVYYPFMWIDLALVAVLKNIWPAIERENFERAAQAVKGLPRSSNAASRKKYGRS